MLLLATAIAAAVSFIAVKWLLRYVQTHTFVLFGWYRIGVAVLIGLLLVFGAATEQQMLNKKVSNPSTPIPSSTIAALE